MTEFNLWKEKAKNFTRIGVNKAKDLGEIARLNMNNLAEEEKIKQAYIEIGERYVRLHEQQVAEEFEELIQKVKQAKATIQINKEKISYLQQETGDFVTEDPDEVEKSER